MLSPQLPLRVLVIGASTVNWTSWMSGPRSDLAFPRAIEAELLAQGRAVQVRNAALLASPTKAFFDKWEEQVLQWSPDVIVGIAGHYETIHLLLPRHFERHANRVDYRPGRLRNYYRKRFLRSLWKVSATFQAAVDRRVPAGVSRRRLDRVAQDLTAYIALSRQVASPACFFLEILPPADRQRDWFPRMTERVHLVNERVAAVCDAMGTADVQFVRTSEVAARLYGEDQQAATPDGFHFTPELHREIGAELARRILAWERCASAHQPPTILR